MVLEVPVVHTPEFEGPTQADNVGGNPAAAFDIDVSNDAIGGLGSPLWYAWHAD